MANGGYTGALPARDDSPEAYSGVWESQEQYAELAAGRWAQQATGLAPRSVRLNPSDTPYFSRTFGSSGNRGTWTMSWWQKRYSSNYGGIYGTYQNVWGLSTTNDNAPSGGASSTGYTYIEFRDDTLFVGEYYGNGVWAYLLQTTAVYRDFSAWYNYQITLDTSNPIASERVRIYINGQRYKGAWTNEQYPTLGRKGIINQGSVQNLIGAFSTNGQGINYGWLNSSLADFKFIDGQALEPEAFGFFDGAGVWQPRPYRGTYGTNGFYLDFSDNSAATATALGADRSGNGNNWTPNALAVTSNVGQYSSTWTYSATGSNPSGVNDPTGAFLSTSPTIADNSQQSGRQAYVNHNGGTSWIQLNPSSAITGSSLRVFTYQPQGTSGADTWMNINGGSDLRPWRVSANYTGWSNAVSISGGSLTSLRMSLSYGGGSAIGFFAIEVDGVILREYSPADIDSLLDSPVNGRQSDTGLGGQVQGNYCTWNPLDTASATLTNGNLDISTPSSGFGTTRGTIGVSSGKWYFEQKIGSGATAVGVLRTSDSLSAILGGTSGGYSYYSEGAGYTKKINNNTQTDYGASFVAGDVIGVALDLDAGTITFYKNGSSQGQAFSGLTGTFAPAVSDGTNAGGIVGSANFGQRQWAYAAPSGFRALCTANLPEPAVKRGDDYFQTLLYTGNGSTQTLSGFRFSPDFVWTKARNTNYSHQFIDIIRGGTNVLFSDRTDPGGTYQSITSFNSDGYTVSTELGVNGSTTPFVAWAWDAGTSTVTDGSGSIQSTRRTNPSAGFSVVTYTGNGLNGATVAHGLNATPSMILYKRRNGTAQDWGVWHTSGGLKLMQLNTASSWWNSAANYWESLPTSTMIYPDNSNGDHYQNVSGANYVAYCFASVMGFSSFGSYSGDGSTSGFGPFIHCGFRPRLIIIKGATVAYDWLMLDSVRNPYNLTTQVLYANSATSEMTNNGTGSGGYESIDILSNGFQIKSNSSRYNQAGASYIYAAFAEHPFSSARAR